MDDHSYMVEAAYHGFQESFCALFVVDGVGNIHCPICHLVFCEVDSECSGVN